MTRQSQATPRLLRVFLCYASEDEVVARKLCQQLKDCNIDPWLDKEKLKGGQDWDLEITKAVHFCDAILICLSQVSLTKESYFQKEIKLASDAALEKPDGVIYLIPLRLEDCKLPERLKRWHYVDYFTDGGFDRLLETLKHRRESLLHRVKIKPIRCKSSGQPHQVHIKDSGTHLNQPLHRANMANLAISSQASRKDLSRRKITIGLAIMAIVIAITGGVTWLATSNLFFRRTISPTNIQGNQTLVVPFVNGPNGATTTNSYSGSITITVSGYGQSSGPTYADAFYIFTDDYGNPTRLEQNANLCINGKPARNYVAIPPYNSNHIYQFAISLSGIPQQLTFGTCDVYTVDNSGSFTITVKGNY